MNEQELVAIEENCRSFVVLESAQDSAHDITHLERVVQNAKNIMRVEGGDPRIILPATWLHDCVLVPKDSPLRSQASSMAAEQASQYLRSQGICTALLPQIEHAIEAHSFSAGITPQTLEAKIVQDADRLDALGAIGIARCFLTSGALSRPLYQAEDPFCLKREANDGQYSLDHFFVKLLGLAKTMNTQQGRKIADARVSFMRQYLDQLQQEIA